MDGESSPAGTLEAPQTEVRETPNATEPTQGASDQTSTPESGAQSSESASPAAQPAAPKSDKPDISTLLQDPEYRKALLEHEEVQKELHRARSDGGRRAKAELEALINQQREAAAAAAQAEAERQRQKQLLEQRLGMDPYELGETTKAELEQRLQALTAEERQQALETLAEQRAREVVSEREVQLLATYASRWHATGQELAQGHSFTDEERALLDPRYYESEVAYLQGIWRLAEQKGAEKALKEKLPSALEAKLQERLGARRSQEESPAAMPNGAGALSDKDRVAAFARGENNDHAYMNNRLKEWGVL